MIFTTRQGRGRGRGSLLGLVFLTLLSSSTVLAQLTNLPDLNTVTDAVTKDDSDSQTTATSDDNTDATSAATTDRTTDRNGRTTATNTDDSTSDATSAASTDTTDDNTSTTASSGSSNAQVTNAPTLTTGGGRPALSLSGLPTIAGAGIPTMIVPNTHKAPYMQKASVPEGTFFIAVGAVLGFLGFCVVAWRAMVAWSVERSVKKAALASVMATDDKTGWPSNPFKSSGPVYTAAPKGSSLSLDALTAQGKPVSTARATPGRQNRPLIPSGGSGLFFSPTASIVQQNQSGMPSSGLANSRSSTYLPAGYYANPSAAAAGGASTTSLGRTGNSPPQSPERGTQRRNPNMLSVNAARNSNNRMSAMSGLGAGQRPISALRDEEQPGMRAPSAYLDDLFGGAGAGPGSGQPRRP